VEIAVSDEWQLFFPAELGKKLPMPAEAKVCATFSALSSTICPWVWTILLAVLWLVEIQPSHPL